MDTLPLERDLDSRSGGSASRLGFWTAILTVVVVAVFAAVAVATPARSGPYCANACVAYPYVDVARFVPGDYLWLLPGILLAPIFLVLMACIHASAAEAKKVYSRIGLAFALVYAVVILVDYFVQLTVVAPSLQAGETERLSLFTQYNPRGLFIALESLGYSMMTVAFLFRRSRVRRWKGRARNPGPVHAGLRAGGRCLRRSRGAGARPRRVRSDRPHDHLDGPDRVRRVAGRRVQASRADPAMTPRWPRHVSDSGGSTPS
jgi:hypothetical protein